MRVETLTLKLQDGSTADATIRVAVGPFVVHRPVGTQEKKNCWHVTHKRTSLRAARVRKLEDAQRLALALAMVGGWAFDDRDQMSAATRQQSYELVRQYAID